MNVDIIKNGYIFTNVPAIIRIDPSINQNGDVVPRSAQDIRIKLHVPIGITIIDFQTDTNGVVYDDLSTTVDIAYITSTKSIVCNLMIRVDDYTTAVNSQWRIDLEDVTGNPIQTFRYEPIIVGGLTTQDIINAIGIRVDQTVEYVSTTDNVQTWRRVDANTNETLGTFIIELPNSGGGGSNPYPTAVTVTGTSTKTITITMSSGLPLTTAFTDLNTDTNTTYTLVPNVGNTAFNLVNNSNVVVSTITFPVLSIQHTPCSIASGAGIPGNPLVVNAPVPDYYYLTSTLTPNTLTSLSIAAIFPSPCPGGCSPMYDVDFNTAVYASVIVNTISGTIELTTVANPVSGNHPVVINRTCG